MMSANRFFVRLSTAAFLLAMMSVFGVRLRAQDVPAVHVGDATITGIPDDWTHHHVFFSDPGTEQDAVKNGTHEEWLKTVNDPRYVIQQLKRGLPAQGPAAQDVEMRQRINAQGNGTPGQGAQNQGAQSGVTPERWTGPRGVEGGPRSFGPGATADVSKTPLTRDWSMNVGGTADSLTLTIATLTNANITTASTLTIEGVTFDANAPTATEIGTFTGSPTTGQTVTVGTQVLTASPSTPATQTGTFSTPPTAANAITVKIGGNTLTLTTNATPSSVQGTAEGGISAPGATITVVAGANTLTLTDNATASSSAIGKVGTSAYTNTIPTIQITNAATGVGLTLVSDAAGESVTGTFLGTPGPAVNQTIVIAESAQADTLTLTGVTGGTGTITVTGIPGFYFIGGDSLTVNGITYTFNISNCATTANCILTPSGITEPEMAQNIAAAITATPALCYGAPAACYGTGTVAVGNISAVASTSGANGLVTVTNYSGAAMNWAYTPYTVLGIGNTDLKLSPTGSIAVGAAGSGTCTSSGGGATAGTFVINPLSTNGAAANVNAAINACLKTYPVVGVISKVSGNVITVSDTATGTYSTITPNPNGNESAVQFLWAAGSGGNQGSNMCNGSTVGQFATGTAFGTAPGETASNISQVINMCGAAAGITSVYNGDNTFTVTNPTPGASLTLAADTGGYSNIFSWGTQTGSNGTTGCSSGTTGNYQTSYTATGLATNIAAAIAACPAMGLNASSSGATVTVTTPLPGASTSISSVATTEPTNVFVWSSPILGLNGTQTCTGSTGGTYITAASPATLAANLAATINQCNTSSPAVGVTAAVSGSTVTLSADTWGTGGNGGTLTPTTTGFFKWTGGTLGGGANGNNLTTNFAVTNVPATNATNLAAAINRYTATTALASATPSGATVIVTASMPGAGGNSVATASAATGFSWPNSTLTGGADGVTSGTAEPPTFAFTSGNAYSTPTQLASNLAAAITANPTLGPLMTATPGTGTLLLTALADGSGGAYTQSRNGSFTALTPASGTFSGGAAGGTGGQSPAKYSYATNSTVGPANCTSDYVIYPTAAPGSSTQATVIAYNNMYKGTCTGSVPAIYWAYNTGGTATLSPILNFEGTEVAYVQTTGGTASLVLLKMASSGSAVTAPTSVTAANYRACTAPCYTALSLGANDNDTNSAPWWDYAHDVIFVGDNAGKLHKFSGVFNGATPVEVGSPFATITPTAALGTLTGPVVDAATGNIYIGESYSGTNYPLMAQVTSAGAVTYSHAGARGTGLGAAYLDAPIVDQSAGRVYAFIGDDNNNATASTCGSRNSCSAVYQLTESTFTSTAPIEVTLGHVTASAVEYAGSFNNTYFNSANPAQPTGTLYVCGYASGVPTLYAIPITGAAGMTAGAAPAGTALASGTATCSPITEVGTGTTETNDYIFLSVTQNGSLTASGAGCKGTGAAGACVYSFNLGTSASTPAAGLLANGGTGEIIIDNVSGAQGASQIYYTTLSSQACAGQSGVGSPGYGTGACAVQASQAALQ